MTTTQNQPMTYRQTALREPAEPVTGPKWLAELRVKAAARFRAIGGFPEPRHEDWKHIDLAALLDRPLNLAPRPINIRPWMPQKLRKDEHHRFVAQGFHLSDPGLRTWQAALPEGVIFEGLSDALRMHKEIFRHYLARGIEAEQDPFYLINTLWFDDGAFLYVPEGAKIDKPIHIWLLGPEDRETSVFYPRILVIAGGRSQCRIQFHLPAKTPGAYVMNAAAELHLLEGADVRASVIQSSGPASYEFFSTRAYLGAQSRFDMTTVSTGEGVGKYDTRIFMAGEGASASLGGLSLLSGSAQNFSHTIVHHSAPSTTSRQLFKDILAGNARSEYSGLVHVHKEGQKADSNQTSRNLLLSDDARSDSRPQLKIDADDVKCNHGSATGALEGQEIFYLRSRGIPADKARSLLIYGFAEEVVETIEPAEVRGDAEEEVRRGLLTVAGTRVEA